MDNMLDTISTPLSIVAGVIATGSVVVDVSPLLSWTIAIVLGGGTATTIQLLTVKARALSSFFTAGIGNPIVATGELFFSILIPILAILVPIVALGLIILGVIIVQRMISREDSSQNKEFEKV
jgi:hypothetical protein